MGIDYVQLNVGSSSLPPDTTAPTVLSITRFGDAAKLKVTFSEKVTAATANLPTPKLTRALEEAVEHQQPRRKGSIRPKLRYAHQGGQNPPVIVIHGNALDAIDANYKRYLEKHFRETFSLVGTPLRIELRSGKNPFAKSE